MKLQKKSHLENTNIQRNLGLDWLLLFGITWMAIGVFVDGWAHNNLSESIETFFTPWHALFYSGFAVTALIVIGVVIKNYLKIRSWKKAIPAGYGLALIGLLFFGIGGMGDMIWHIIFGIEKGVDALLSPTHLIIAIGMGLVVSTPIRSAWKSTKMSQSIWSWLPIIISVTILYSIFTFITQFGSPLKHPWVMLSQQPIVNNLDETYFHGQAMGVDGAMIETLLFMGVILFLLSRWRMPFGSWTIMFGLTALGMSFMNYYFIFILPAILAGFVIDLITYFFDPHKNLKMLRIYAFLVPVVYYGIYIISILLGEGTWYSIHLLVGMIMLVGIEGWLLSFLVMPPKFPTEN